MTGLADTAVTTRLWFSTSQAADRVGCHPDTILKALQAGELHGSQRQRDGKPLPGARWRIHVRCLDSWALGQPCEHSP